VKETELHDSKLAFAFLADGALTCLQVGDACSDFPWKKDL